MRSFDVTLAVVVVVDVVVVVVVVVVAVVVVDVEAVDAALLADVGFRSSNVPDR
jgi:hypothetical protein